MAEGTKDVSKAQFRTDLKPTDTLLLVNSETNEVQQVPADLFGKPIEFNSVAEMKSMDEVSKSMIRNGMVKAVQLNGYYQANDTPAPILYFPSETSVPEDGGSVFEVGESKLKHEFKDGVNIKYFGAKVDPLFDSYPAFKRAVAYCNRTGVLIKVDDKFTFKSDGSDISIYVDVDFTGSDILMDPDGNIDFKLRLVPKPEDVFNTQNMPNSDKMALLNEIETAINTNSRVLTGVAFTYLANKYCCLRILTSRRTPEMVETNRLVTQQTWYKEENFFVDINGNIDGVFYNNDLDLIGDDGEPNYLIRAFDFNLKREFKGGSLKFAESKTGASGATYRQIGFYFEGLCNLTIYDSKADLWGIKDNIFGYIRPVECYNVEVKNLSAIPANHRESDMSTSSSYVLNITDCQNVLVDKYMCPNILDSSQWGSTCGHRSYNVKYINSVASRIDCHYRGFDWAVENCKLGHSAIQFCGGGRWSVKNVEVYNSQYVLSGRADYASEFLGDIYVENVTLFTSFDDNNAIVSVNIADDPSNAYNLHPNNPAQVITSGGYNIYLKNVRFSNAMSSGARENIVGSALRLPQSSPLTQNIKLPNVNVDTVTFENVGSGFSEFVPVRFGRYYVFMAIKQGYNGSDITEASSLERPTFTEINNQIIEIRNADLGRATGENIVRFNVFEISDFNNSDNKDMAPMPVARLFNCTNVSPISRVYRMKIETIDCTVSSGLSHVFNGFYSYPKWDVKGGVIFVDQFNYPMISGTSMPGDVAINNVVLDYKEGALDARITTFLFSTTDYPSPTLTPRLWMLNNYQRRVRNNYLSERLKTKLIEISNGLVVDGNKGFTISYVENTLLNSKEGYIDVIRTLSDLPVFNNIAAYEDLRILYSTSTVKEELFYDRVNNRWINKNGALAGSQTSGTTAQRPNLNDVPIGYGYLDFTLGKSIFKRDASTWIDAIGNPV